MFYSSRSTPRADSTAWLPTTVATQLNLLTNRLGAASTSLHAVAIGGLPKCSESRPNTLQSIGAMFTNAYQFNLVTPIGVNESERQNVDIDVLEKVQRRATKLVKGEICAIDLTTLELEVRGDIMLTGKENMDTLDRGKFFTQNIGSHISRT